MKDKYLSIFINTTQYSKRTIIQKLLKILSDSSIENQKSIDIATFSKPKNYISETLIFTMNDYPISYNQISLNLAII